MENREQNLQKLRKLIKGIKFAMLTTADENGNLRSRPMATQEADAEGDLWFFTRLDTAKVEEARKDEHVNVSYSQPDEHRYVSVSGLAQIVRDPEKMRELWNPAYKAFFPEGLDDPQIALMRVMVYEAEYWTSPSSYIGQAIGFVRAFITDDKKALDDNQRIEM